MRIGQDRTDKTGHEHQRTGPDRTGQTTQEIDTKQDKRTRQRRERARHGTGARQDTTWSRTWHAWTGQDRTGQDKEDKTWDMRWDTTSQGKTTAGDRTSQDKKTEQDRTTRQTHDKTGQNRY